MSQWLNAPPTNPDDNTTGEKRDSQSDIEKIDQTRFDGDGDEPSFRFVPDGVNEMRSLLVRSPR